MDQLTSRVAVVTGAASGIGRAIAKQCLEAGMRVALVDVELDSLTRTAHELDPEGSLTMVRQVDVRDAEQVERLAESVVGHFGTVHLLCNNAGVDAGGHFGDISQAAWRWVMDVNFFGVVNGCRAFLPALRSSGEGHIVNTASMAAVNAGIRTMAPYIASKFAVLGATENLAVELSESDPTIGVSVLLPGGVQTRMTESERNRPADVPPIDDPLRESVVNGIRSATAREGLDPKAVAVAVLDAVRNRSFYILTHREPALDAVAQRLEWMTNNSQPLPRVLQ